MTIETLRQAADGHAIFRESDTISILGRLHLLSSSRSGQAVPTSPKQTSGADRFTAQVVT